MITVLESDQQPSSAALNMKTLHIIFLTVVSVTLLGAVGGLIAWGVIASNNCLVPEISKGLPHPTSSVVTTEATSLYKAASPLVTVPGPRNLTVERTSPVGALAAPPALANLDWWQHCVIYEIYPLSFKDSDGDGIGDLEGIIGHLNHLKDAGVDTIIMNPVFESSMIDFGYDIINVYRIHEVFGTMEDFDNLLKRAHDIGIKILLNVVPNHGSAESEHFRLSEERDPQYKDFFVWADAIKDPADPSNRLPPSNWRSQFGGSAWEWSEKRLQYYLHQFDDVMVDFNFRNPAVKQEKINVMKFWLDKGVDGFWLDSVSLLLEADPADYGGRYPDNPKETVHLYNSNLIELYDIVYEWRQFIDKYNEEHGGDTRVLLTTSYINTTMAMMYYGNKQGAMGAHFPFNFDLIRLNAKSNARDFVNTILTWLTYMPNGAVANWQFGNHDNNRLPTRFRPAMVDGLNSLIMMLPGTSITYQGEEIGMRDGYVSWADTLDVDARRQGNENTYHLYSRDFARTPYHWDDSINAGFSTGDRTWLPVAEDYKEINLAKQKADERSHFKVYQALTALRKEKTLSHGEYDIRALSDSSFYLVRSLRTYDTLVLLFNVGEDPDTIALSRVLPLKTPATVHISSIHSSRVAGHIIDGEKLTLVAGEALILRAPPV